jgi:hypothetical protein
MFHHYTDGVDVAVRYESIDHDIRDVFARAGIPTDTPIPTVNQTDERPDRDYRAFYSRDSILAVRAAFSDDIRRYGYSF